MSVLTLRSHFVILIITAVFLLSLSAIPAVADGDDPELPDPRGIGLWSTGNPLPRGNCFAIVIWLDFNGTLVLAF
jgi:hypothetical protein